MSTKLAGRLPLQDMITSVIADARQKLAAAEDDKSEKVRKLVEYEKREHGGHIPSVKEERAEMAHEKEEGEKKASALSDEDYAELDKLASALDYVGDLMKEADAVELGGESHQGGMVLPTAVPPKGTQPYKHDKSRTGNIPMSPAMHSDPSQGPAATQMSNNAHHMVSGTQKMSSVSETLAKIAANKYEAHLQSKGLLPKPGMSGRPLNLMRGDIDNIPGALADAAIRKHREATRPGSTTKGNLSTSRTGNSTVYPPPPGSNRGGHISGVNSPNRNWYKTSSADLGYILNKIAESGQGGMTLDSKSGEGPKPPADSAGGNDVRRFLESSEAAVRMKKVDGKGPQKLSLIHI